MLLSRNRTEPVAYYGDLRQSLTFSLAQTQRELASLQEEAQQITGLKDLYQVLDSLREIGEWLICDAEWHGPIQVADPAATYDVVEDERDSVAAVVARLRAIPGVTTAAELATGGRQ